MNPANILSKDEVQTVLTDLRLKSSRSSHMHLAIFRLSACCGLRCKEISGLNIRDVRINGARPYVQVRKEVTKGERGKRKPRCVPLWWDEETYQDLRGWKEHRLRQTQGQDGPLLAAQRRGHEGKRLTRQNLARQWRATIAAALGEERAENVSIHCGRHSFTSLCHQAGVSLASIRDALGHSSLAITDIYCHAVEDDIKGVFG